MQFGRLPRKTLLAATLCLAFSAANAAFLEQTGTPAAPPVVMKTYGVDVSTRVGLKAVIPAGWQLFVHRSVELPESLSWKVDETWVSVLNNFSTANDVAVLVDWDKKAVYFRSTEVALQEQEKRQMITQAAATPLPSFKADEPTPARVAKAVEAVAALAPVTDKPAERVADTEASKTAEVVTASVASVSGGLASGAAAALAPVVAAVAIPQPSEAVVVPLPAAPAASTPRVSTLDRILDGATKPVLAVEPVAPAIRPLVLPLTAAPVVVAMAPAPAPLLTVAQAPATPVAVVLSAPQIVTAPAAVASAVSVPAPAAVTSAAPATAYAEQPLTERPAGEAFNRKAVDEVIRSAADKNGYLVSWEAADVQFPGPVTILGADMGEDMRLVLRALGGRRSPVSIDVYRASNVVRVRNASGAAEVALKDEPFNGALREKSASLFTAKVVLEAPQPRIVVAVPAPTPAPITVAKAPAPIFVAAPVVATVAPVPAPAPVPQVVVAEPERLDTAVEAIKKLAPSVTEHQPAAQIAAIVLRVEAGESLRTAIEGILEQGWTLKWQVNGDMEANTRLEVGGESLAAILNKVLPRLSLSADIYKPSKLIVIRPADAALDK